MFQALIPTATDCDIKGCCCERAAQHRVVRSSGASLGLRPTPRGCTRSHPSVVTCARAGPAAAPVRGTVGISFTAAGQDHRLTGEPHGLDWRLLPASSVPEGSESAPQPGPPCGCQLLDELRDAGGPAGLVGGAVACAGLAMEELVELVELTQCRNLVHPRRHGAVRWPRRARCWLTRSCSSARWPRRWPARRSRSGVLPCASLPEHGHKAV